MPAPGNLLRLLKGKSSVSLSVGSDADIAILNIRKGKFGLFDYTGYKIETDKKLECEMTIRAGKIVYDLNGIANPVTLYAQKQLTGKLSSTRNR